MCVCAQAAKDKLARRHPMLHIVSTVPPHVRVIAGNKPRPIVEVSACSSWQRVSVYEAALSCRHDSLTAVALVPVTRAQGRENVFQAVIIFLYYVHKEEKVRYTRCRGGWGLHGDPHTMVRACRTDWEAWTCGASLAAC